MNADSTHRPLFPSWTRPGATIAVGLVLAVHFVAPRSESRAAGEPFGFLDLTRVIQGYDKTGQRKDAVERDTTSRITKLEEKSKTIDEDEEALQFLNPGSKEYREKKIEIHLARERLRLELESIRGDYDRAVTAFYDEILKEIAATADAVRTERGYAAVFRSDTGRLDGAEKDEEEILVKLGFRQVVSFEKALDITEEVIRRLNAGVKR